MIVEIMRKYQLDFFRVFACLYVMLYHYFYYGPLVDNIPAPSETFAAFKYGFLGVDVFFIISGYVIFNSLKGHCFSGFFKARIQRLYPVYWLCVTVTAIHLMFFSSGVSLYNYILNLSMFQSIFGIENVDGVYWTLVIEIFFYFLVSIFYYVLPKKLFTLYLSFWLFLSSLHMLDFYDFNVFGQLLLLNWAPYFILGISTYKLVNLNLNFSVIIIFLVSLALCLYRTYERGLVLSNMVGASVEPFTASLILLIMFLVMFISLFFTVELTKSKKLILSLSLSTYPFYLLHQEIGYGFINLFSENSEYQLALVPLIAVYVFLISNLVVRLDKFLHKRKLL